MGYFRNSFIVTFIGLGLGAFLGWQAEHTIVGAFSTLFIVSVLAILEISLSFDNAVVNATVYRRDYRAYRPLVGVVMAATDSDEYSRVLTDTAIGETVLMDWLSDPKPGSRSRRSPRSRSSWASTTSSSFPSWSAACPRRDATSRGGWASASRWRRASRSCSRCRGSCSCASRCSRIYQKFSGRDLILIAGGLFLLWKSVHEIHDSLEGEAENDQSALGNAATSFAGVLVQIAIIDIVFSLDSVITAVGLADDVSVMVVAIVLSVAVMMFAARPIGEFVERHPTIKMLALSFLCWSASR